MEVEEEEEDWLSLEDSIVDAVLSAGVVIVLESVKAPTLTRSAGMSSGFLPAILEFNQ